MSADDDQSDRVARADVANAVVDDFVLSQVLVNSTIRAVVVVAVVEVANRAVQRRSARRRSCTAADEQCVRPGLDEVAEARARGLGEEEAADTDGERDRRQDQPGHGEPPPIAVLAPSALQAEHAEHNCRDCGARSDHEDERNPAEDDGGGAGDERGDGQATSAGSARPVLADDLRRARRRIGDRSMETSEVHCTPLKYRYSNRPCGS